MSGGSGLLDVTQMSVGKTKGSSPSEDQYYLVMFFDISEPKKYRTLVKIMKSYGNRIQKSVFEAQLRSYQIKDLINKVKRVMESRRYYNESDNVRFYKIAGNCEVTVLGECDQPISEENIFF